MNYFEIRGEKSPCTFHVLSNISEKVIRSAEKKFSKEDVHHSAIYNDEKLDIQMSATEEKIKNYGIFL